MRLARILLGSLPIVLYTFSSSSNSYEGDQLARVKTAAKYFGLSVRRHPKRGFTVVLPEGAPAIPGFSERRDPKNRRVVTPADDLQFTQCAQTAAKSGGLSSAGSVSLDPVGTGTGWMAALGQYNLDLGNCILDHGERVYEALSELAQDGRLNGYALEVDDFRKEFSGLAQEVQGTRSSMLALEERLKQQIRDELGAALKKKLQAGDMEKIAAEGVTALRLRISQYIKEKRQQHEEAEARRITIANLQLLETGLSSAIDIGLSDKPQLASKLKAGVSGFSKLGQIVVQLSGSTSPFQAVMLGLSGAGVVNSLMNIWGGEAGPTYDELILGEVQALRGDIDFMRKEMHGRFDELYQFLNAFYAFTHSHFSKIESQLAELTQSLDELNEEEAIRAKIVKEALAYLLSSPVTLQAQMCLEGQAKATLSENAFGNCLGGFKLYSTGIARLDMIVGAGLIGEDLLGDVSRRLYLTIDAGQTFGYLYHLDERFTAPQPRTPPNPTEWARGADAYLRLYSYYDEIPLVRSARSRADSVALEKSNIEQMLAAGSEIKREAARLRKQGLLALLDLYAKEASTFADYLGTAVENGIVARGVPSLAQKSWRAPAIEQINNHSSHFRACATLNYAYELQVGAHAGEHVVYKSGKYCGSDYVTDKDNDAEYKRGALEWVTKNAPESLFPLSIVVDSAAAQVDLRKRFVSSEPTNKYATTDQVAIIPEVEKAVLSEAGAKQLARIAFVKALLIQAAVLGYYDTLPDGRGEVVQTLLEIPADGETLRRRLNDHTYSSEVALKATVAATVTTELTGFVQELKKMLVAAEADQHYPFVDIRIDKLQRLLHGGVL